MATELELKATAKKISNCLVLITCWMEESAAVVNRNPRRKTATDWHTTVKLGNSRFCSLYLEELVENRKTVRLCLKLLNAELQNEGKLASVEVFREGAHRFKVNMKRMTDWWDSKWIKSTNGELLFNQLLLSFSSPMDVRTTLQPIKEEEVRERPIKKGEEKTLQQLSTLLQTKFLTDVIFNVQGERFEAHRVILAAGSPVLSAMFWHDFQENRTRTVNIEDTNPRVFKQLLEYLYTGTASEIEKKGVAIDLLVASDKYGVNLLKEECSAILMGTNLSVYNVIPILIIAHLHSVPKLVQLAIDFMAQNAFRICSLPDYRMLMINYPTLCLKVTQSMFERSIY